MKAETQFKSIIWIYERPFNTGSIQYSDFL